MRLWNSHDDWLINDVMLKQSKKWKFNEIKYVVNWFDRDQINMNDKNWSSNYEKRYFRNDEKMTKKTMKKSFIV